jgi:hypothetical protein
VTITIILKASRLERTSFSQGADKRGKFPRQVILRGGQGLERGNSELRILVGKGAAQTEALAKFQDRHELRTRDAAFNQIDVFSVQICYYYENALVLKCVSIKLHKYY